MVRRERGFTVRAMAIEAVLLGFLSVGYLVKWLVNGIDRQGSGCFVGSEQQKDHHSRRNDEKTEVEQKAFA